MLQLLRNGRNPSTARRRVHVLRDGVFLLDLDDWIRLGRETRVNLLRRSRQLRNVRGHLLVVVDVVAPEGIARTGALNVQRPDPKSACAVVLAIDVPVRPVREMTCE